MRGIIRAFYAIMVALCFSAVIAAQDEYRVGKLDVLKIEVAGEPDLTRESATVTEKGAINFGVLGELKVEGLTASKIGDLIRDSLIGKKILRQPTVTVTVKEYRSQWVTILGEVKTTGRYYLRGPERLLDKVAEAGGLGLKAGDITISRSGPGGTKILTIKNSALVSDSTTLLSGDVIFVKLKEESRVYVSGEIMSTKPLDYYEGMTAYQAILMAGGLNRFGSKSRVTVKRTIDGKEQIIKLNLSDIERGKAKDLILLPNDTIMVGRRIF